MKIVDAPAGDSHDVRTLTSSRARCGGDAGLTCLVPNHEHGRHCDVLRDWKGLCLVAEVHRSRSSRITPNEFSDSYTIACSAQQSVAARRVSVSSSVMRISRQMNLRCVGVWICLVVAVLGLSACDSASDADDGGDVAFRDSSNVDRGASPASGLAKYLECGDVASFVVVVGCGLSWRSAAPDVQEAFCRAFSLSRQMYIELHLEACSAVALELAKDEALHCGYAHCVYMGLEPVASSVGVSDKCLEVVMSSRAACEEVVSATSKMLVEFMK